MRNILPRLFAVLLVLWPLIWIGVAALLCKEDYAYWYEYIARNQVFKGVLLPFTLLFLFGPTVAILVTLARARGVRDIWTLASVTITVGTLFIFTHHYLAAFQPTKCKSNMQILAEALERYQDDHKGYLPDANHWVDEIYPYVKDWKVFRCPADSSQGRSSYAMNANVSGKKLSWEKGAETTILLYETTKSGQNPRGVGADLPKPGRHFVDDYCNWFAFPAGWAASAEAKMNGAHW